MGIEVAIVELPAGSSWWQQGSLDTLRVLRPGLEERSLHRVLLEGARDGLRYHGAVASGRCVGSRDGGW